MFQISSVLDIVQNINNYKAHIKHARKLGYITEADITIADVYSAVTFKIVGIADGSRVSHRISGQIQALRFYLRYINWMR